MENITPASQTPAPETDFSSGPSLLHPLTQGAATLHLTLQPIAAHIELEQLSNELADALIADGIYDLGDSAVLLAMQARLLNAVFNRFLLQGLAADKPPNLDLLRVGLLAQRQSAAAVDKLKRHKSL